MINSKNFQIPARLPYPRNSNNHQYTPLYDIVKYNKLSGKFEFDSSSLVLLGNRYPVKIVSILGNRTQCKLRVLRELGFHVSKQEEDDLKRKSCKESSLKLAVKHSSKEMVLHLVFFGPSYPWKLYNQRIAQICYLLSDTLIYTSSCGLDRSEKEEFEAMFSLTYEKRKYCSRRKSPRFFWIVQDIILPYKFKKSHKLETLLTNPIKKIFRDTKIIMIDTFLGVKTQNKDIEILSKKTENCVLLGKRIDTQGFFFILTQIVKTFGMEEELVFSEIISSFTKSSEGIIILEMKKMYKDMMNGIVYPIGLEKLIKKHVQTTEKIENYLQKRAINILNDPHRLFTTFLANYVGGIGSGHKNKINNGTNEILLFFHFKKLNKIKSIEKSNEKLVELYKKNVSKLSEYSSVEDLRIDINRFKNMFLRQDNLGPKKVEILETFLRDEKQIVNVLKNRLKKQREKTNK